MAAAGRPEGSSPRIGLLRWLKPPFTAVGPTLPSGEKPLFNYRRVWRMTVVGMAGSALAPLVILTVFNLYQYRRALVAETQYPIARIVSNTQRTISSFIAEHRAAMEFIVLDNDFVQLSDQARLTRLFERLRDPFEGFVDLGVIDHDGRQLAYVGPYDLGGRDYSDQEWFARVQREGVFVSEVFRGFRNVPHFAIAARHDDPSGRFYVVRATVDAARLTRLVLSIDIHPDSDAFIIDRKGILQTDSRFHGKALERLDLPVPTFTKATVVEEVDDGHGRPLVMGHVDIEGTPFVLVVLTESSDLLRGWLKLRGTMLTFLAFSIIVIFLVTLGMVTFLVERVYEADLRRTITLHKMEHTNKMASVGRLAAGVAHEINNPLAVISEKAGLLQDLLTMTDRYSRDEKVLGLVESILKSVKRCSAITHRLLGFAKHVDVEFKALRVEEVVSEKIYET